MNILHTAQHQIVASSEKGVRLGSIAAARAGWGQPVSNTDLIAYYQAAGHDPTSIAPLFDQTGFEHGYYSPPDSHIYSDEVQEWHVQAGAHLARRVIAARGWDALDILIIASSTTTNWVPSAIQSRLAEDGIQIRQTQLYAQACNGALAGINDLIRTPHRRGQRAVVVGMESLTGLMCDLDDPTTMRTFGNGGGAVAFIVGEEIEHIVGRSVAEYDVAGVLRGPQVFQLPTTPSPDYDWYELAGTETADKFIASADGVFMSVPPSPDRLKLVMHGLSTLHFFAKRVPPLVYDVVQRYRAGYQASYGDLGVPFSHQPSRPVTTYVNQELARLLLEGDGVPIAEVRRVVKRLGADEVAAYLQARGLPVLSIPWVMNRTGFNNVSAGTSMVTLVQMIEDGTLQLEQATPVVGFGIGSVIQADVWRFMAG